MGIAISVPILLGLQFNHIEIGLPICFGAFWSSPSDISGSFKRKKTGITISAGLVTVVSFIGSYLHYETWGSLPVLGLLSFGVAYISVYGFRGSLIGFSGLLAMVISLAQEHEVLEIYQFALLVGVGGLWYLLLAKIWQLINPKGETEELLTATYLLTADFIETRGKLVGPQQDPNNLPATLIKLQSELTKNHETLREILILSRKASGWSSYEDKRLLVFVQLVEMMETAIANPVNYDRMDALLRKHPQYIKLFQELIFKMAQQLRLIAAAGNDKKKLPKSDRIMQCFEAIKTELAAPTSTLDYEEHLMLHNMLGYQEKQFEKLKRIKWLLGDPDMEGIELIDKKTANRFVAPQDFDPRLLVSNFSFKSALFRHSLRLAVTVMIGYVLGSLFAFQNPYWILLTIVVIMRPNYGLTKSRAKDRTIGTLIGGVLAIGLVFLIQDHLAYGIMGILSLVIALALIQKNGKASAMFITLSVVFIYAILQPDVLTVIKFRVVDTLVGAALSYAAMLWLWPTWESGGISDSIKKAVKANKDFLQKITTYYQQKGKIPTSYTLARRGAFAETSNLNSAFQRMAAEPKLKQKETEKIYELVVLNHSFLASLASLSTYIQQHKTSDASEGFNLVSEKILKNLERVLQCLEDAECDKSLKTSVDKNLFEEALPDFNAIDFRNVAAGDKETKRNLQEAHLVWEQLKWLFSISCKMIKLAERI